MFSLLSAEFQFQAVPNIAPQTIKNILFNKMKAEKLNKCQ